MLSAVLVDNEEEATEGSSMMKESCFASENPDQEVIVEALKSICNILLHNETGQVSVLGQQLHIWGCDWFFYVHLD